jgi:nucleotide-binding universal stress UspA family protein
MPEIFDYRRALQSFQDARFKATMQDILARLGGNSNELLSYDEVARKLKLHARTERGIQQIPLKAIIGSVGRYTDFTRSFLPRETTNPERWARVKTLMEDPTSPGWPPIEVYQVGEAYFVLDGNHRVSVARQEGFETIEAHVFEVKTNIPLTPDTSPDDLIIKTEYADFLAQTEFDRLIPGIALDVTVPGQYKKLYEHIEVHRYFMGIELGREVSPAEAVVHWYDTVYTPVLDPIRQRGLLKWFPSRTETDMYLWVSEHRAVLQKELGWWVRPEIAAEDLATRANRKVENEESQPGQWRKARLMDRYGGRLFRDILVPLTGEPQGWAAFEQAARVAQREDATLRGLFVITKPHQEELARHVQTEFEVRCNNWGVHGHLAIERGRVFQILPERALLTDLMTLPMSHPPVGGLALFTSRLHHILWRTTRPVLTVRNQPTEMQNILLAFDGSPRSREALFVATYLAEQWHSKLTVWSAAREQHLANAMQETARAYLDLHEQPAEFIAVRGNFSTIHDSIHALQPDLLAMGGYGTPIWQQVLFGSPTDSMLRSLQIPLLICR